MAKLRTRLCSNCHKQQRTGNAYCKACDAARKAEERGRVPMPETEGDRETRELTDKTFALLEAAPDTEVEVKGIKVKSNQDGTVTFALKNRQQRRLAEWVKAHNKGA